MESVLKTAFPFIVYGVAILLAFQGVLMIVAYTVLAEAKSARLDAGSHWAKPCRAAGACCSRFADLLKFIFKEDLVPINRRNSFTFWRR
jgi:NADH:ubiquinone oxidoreductase subunit H